MKTKFNLKLTARLILSVIVPAALLLGITQVYIGYKSYQNSKEEGIEKVTAQSREIASRVEGYVNGSFESVSSLKNSMMALHSKKSPNRDDVNKIMAEILLNNKNYLAIWHMWEPNAFDRNDQYFRNLKLYSKTRGSLNLTYYKDKGKLVNELGTLDQYSQDYYTIPKANMANTLMEPYYYSYVGDTANQFYETSIIVPLMEEKSFIGVVGVDIELSILENIISTRTVYKTGFASIVTDKYQIAAHPDKNMVTKNLLSVLQNDTVRISTGIKNGEEFYVYNNTEKGEVLRYFSPIHINGTKTKWSVMVEVPVSEVTERANLLITILLLANIIGMIIFVLITTLIARSIIKPIIRAADFVNSVSQGDLTGTIELKQKDEIGIMTQNLQQMVTKLRTVVMDISTGASNISNAGSEMSSVSQQLSEGANEQAASTEEVSSSMEEMVSNINQNTDNARQTEHIALQASVDIEDGSKAVFSTLEAMKKIAEKILIIGEIAEKTDLLAINAAIEAARAGEHGKGFAVVATEVRKLAERSQNAAKEIDELSKSSVKIADESGIVLKKIIPDIKKTSLLVQEISAASMEMNSGASQINNAIMQLNTVTQRNATAAEEMSSNAEELVNQADTLVDIVSFFKIGVEIQQKPVVHETHKIPPSPKNNQVKKAKPVVLAPLSDMVNDVDDKQFEQY
jgi:methyl-accepting chemotaxis protein